MFWQIGPAGRRFQSQTVWLLLPKFLHKSPRAQEAASYCASGLMDECQFPTIPTLCHRIPLRMRWALWLGVLGWTALVVLVLGWLVDGRGGPTVWVFGTAIWSSPALEKRSRDHGNRPFASNGLSVDPIQPYLWLWWPGSFLGAGRLLRNLIAVHLTACVAFLLACHWVGFRTLAHRTRFLLAPGPPPLGSASGGRLAVPVPFGNGEGPINGCVRCLGTGIPLRHGPPSLRAAVRSTILDLLAYGAVTGLVHSVYFHRRLRAGTPGGCPESHLARARLDTLQAQLQPHFLFQQPECHHPPCCAGIRGWRNDPGVPERTAALMALSQTGRQEDPFARNWSSWDVTWRFQQTRFGDRLRVEQEIEPAALDCRVPTPRIAALVEARSHGIRPAGGPGIVRLSASRRGATLVLTVEDNEVEFGGSGGAVPLNPAAADFELHVGAGGTRISLANLHDRLRAPLRFPPETGVAAARLGGATVRVEGSWDVSSPNPGRVLET